MARKNVVRFGPSGESNRPLTLILLKSIARCLLDPFFLNWRCPDTHIISYFSLLHVRFICLFLSSISRGGPMAQWLLPHIALPVAGIIVLDPDRALLPSDEKYRGTSSRYFCIPNGLLHDAHLQCLHWLIREDIVHVCIFLVHIGLVCTNDQRSLFFTPRQGQQVEKGCFLLDFDLFNYLSP